MIDLRNPENINGSERHWIPRFDYTPKKSELNKIFVYTLIACWNGPLYQKLICEIGNISERNVRVIVKKLKEEGKIKVTKQGYNVHGIQQPNKYETNEPKDEKRNFNFDLFGELKDSKAIGLYMWMRGIDRQSMFGNPYYVLKDGEFNYFKEQLVKLGEAGMIKVVLDEDDNKKKVLFIKEKRYPHAKY